MSQWMGIQLKSIDIPEDLVPHEEGYGNGQNIPRHVDDLSNFCERLGLVRLDHFIVDHCARVEQALKAAGWVDLESLEEEVTGEDPPGAIYYSTRWIEPGVWKRYATFERTDPEYLASQERYARIEEQVARDAPWFDPSEGLGTVRGLLRLCEQGVPLAWWDDSRARSRAGLIDAGLDPDFVESMFPAPTGSYTGPTWDLRTFELELEYAARHGDRFQFSVSY